MKKTVVEGADFDVVGKTWSLSSEFRGERKHLFLVWTTASDCVRVKGQAIELGRLIKLERN
jgi:hypothetical protein